MGNFLGAFADAAILFPLLAVLGRVEGYSPWTPMLSAGLLYTFAAWFYRIPMAVQPLKSIVIAGVATGASSVEMRWSGAVIGVCCLSALILDLEWWTAQIPRSVIHGVQAGLGVLLIGQGLKALGPSPGGGTITLLAGIVAGVVLLAGSRPDWPLLGVLGTVALFAGLTGDGPPPPGSSESHPVKWGSVLSLALPQIALTMSNSVLATREVCHRYYGRAAEAVTHRRLLTFIGVGNLLTALIGGLPFCHGSGGVTAHYRGGARHRIAGAYIGLFLIVLAIVALANGDFQLVMPPFLLAILLMSTGVFHLALARPTWDTTGGKNRLLAMAAAAIVTKNMLGVLATGIAFEIAARWMPGKEGAS